MLNIVVHCFGEEGREVVITYITQMVVWLWKVITLRLFSALLHLFNVGEIYRNGKIFAAPFFCTLCQSLRRVYGITFSFPDSIVAWLLALRPRHLILGGFTCVPHSRKCWVFCAGSIGVADECSKSEYVFPGGGLWKSQSPTYYLTQYSWCKCNFFLTGYLFNHFLSIGRTWTSLVEKGAISVIAAAMTKISFFRASDFAQN